MGRTWLWWQAPLRASTIAIAGGFLSRKLRFVRLFRKRAELAGEIEDRAVALDQLRADLMHLDAAIRIMDPDAVPELIAPKLPRPQGCDWFGRGELSRMVLDVLREAARPLSSVEIARAVLFVGTPTEEACGWALPRHDRPPRLSVRSRSVMVHTHP